MDPRLDNRWRKNLTAKYIPYGPAGWYRICLHSGNSIEPVFPSEQSAKRAAALNPNICECKVCYHRVFEEVVLGYKDVDQKD